MEGFSEWHCGAAPPSNNPTNRTIQSGGYVPEPPKGITWTIRQGSVTDPLTEAYQQLEQAEALRQQRQFDRARAICEPLVRRYPDYFGALYTLGLVYADKKEYPQALGFLVRAVMLNPHNWRALTALSAVYLELGASEMAAHTLEQAIVINPHDPGILLTLGEIYRQEREYELAREAYRKSFELDRSLHAAGIGFGSCCAHLGQYADAAEIFMGLINDGVHYLGVVSELNQLPASYVTTDLFAELDRIERAENQEEAEHKSLVSFIRASALDRAGRHEEAWSHLVPANRALHREGEARELADMQQANLAQLQGKKIRLADTASCPISLFILGPSRSGKTTMETLTAVLDGVKRGYENPSVENAIRRTFQSAGLLTTGMFEVLPPRLDAACRELYLAELTRRAGTAKVFTNTHPGRIHDAARVAAAFPNVRFIFMKRDVDDTTLRIYMRDYAPGNPYAYDLRSIREHIQWYHRMIDRLAEKLPDITRVIHYENMVIDPAAALRTVADLCRLPMPQKGLPRLGDDRGCAAPYRRFMEAT
jgi:tetratricopeptide (TPR) repeat protein